MATWWAVLSALSAAALFAVGTAFQYRAAGDLVVQPGQPRLTMREAVRLTVTSPVWLLGTGVSEPGWACTPSPCTWDR